MAQWARHVRPALRTGADKPDYQLKGIRFVPLSLAFVELSEIVNVKHISYSDL